MASFAIVRLFFSVFLSPPPVSSHTRQRTPKVPHLPTEKDAPIANRRACPSSSKTSKDHLESFSEPMTSPHITYAPSPRYRVPRPDPACRANPKSSAPGAEFEMTETQTSAS
ncbi:hypothetical protein BGZ61DRAFT_454257, partial [Ilyonectria robusta]|uniref:uncharacterized protein n=1 Tax=Ilyonectria robusta TaxID=1079257 RepID=UPI001E8DA8CC